MVLPVWWHQDRALIEVEDEVYTDLGLILARFLKLKPQM